MENCKASIWISDVFSCSKQRKNTLTAAGSCLFYRQKEFLVYWLFTTSGKLT